MTGSPDALTCPHAEACGACQLLGVGQNDQLERKRRALATELGRHVALRGLPVAPCLPSPRADGYRNRAKMAVALGSPDQQHGVALGYYGEGTHDVVDAPDCRVLQPELLETLTHLRALLAEERTQARGLRLRHLDLRCGSDPLRQHLTLVVEAPVPEQLPTAAIRSRCPRIVGIAVNAHPGTGPQVIKGPIHPAWGEREVWVTIPTARLRVSPGSFFQVNLHLLQPIHDRLRAFFGRGRSLADLYAGVGTHGLALHDIFDEVTCVEGVQRAAGDARASIEVGNILNARVVAAPVEQALRALAGAKPDAVILNPSRAGADDAVIRFLRAGRARRIAYLSCEPRTLARDLVGLVNGGFRVRSILPIDMMPQTRHVEALALLERPRGS